MPDSKDLKDLDSQLKKTLISAESFKRGSSVAVDPSKNILNIQKTLSKLVENVKSLVNIVSNFAKIVNNNSKKISILKNISKTQSSIASGENIGAKLPGSSTSNVILGTPPAPPAPPAVIGTPPAVIGTPPAPPAVIGVAKIVDDLKKLNIKVIDIEKIVNNNSKKITSLKNISRTQSSIASGENIGVKLPGSSTSNVEDSIATITKSVTSIAEILAGRKKTLDNAAVFDRRKAEQEKRGLAEDKLEKRFEGLKSEAEKVISPVKSILDKIIDFFVTVFLGRVVYKLLEWFSDKKNADKVRAIGRFLGDHWPKLLSLYLVFGSALGGFARGLIGLVVKGAVRLAAAAAGMAAKAGIKGAAGAAGFLGGKYGKLLGAGLEVAATVGTTMAVSKGIENFGGGEQKAQGLAGGGYVRPRFPAFSGGGLNFKGMLGGMGDMFGMLFAGGGGVSSGFVSGEKGVDKIPAMLSDGEFVMSAGAVQKYGVDTLEGMNAAGGGTNKPKMISGTTYAAEGGYIGKNPDPNYKNPGEERRLDLIKSLDRYGSAITTGSKEKGGDLLNAITNLSSTLSGGSVGQSSGSGGGQSGTGQSSSIPRGSTSTGSLLTDPLGAAKRIMGIKDSKPSSSKPSSSKPGTPGFIEEIGQKLTGPGASTYLDAGSIYAKQMLGGFDGPISERNLGKDSKAELQKAIERAKLRTGAETAKAEAKIKELESSGASKTPDGRKALATQKSFLKKLNSGGIRVQYADYADSKGKMSDSAKNAKNILGQFWATGRSKKEGGGYRIEDKYDFDAMKKKDNKTGKMRDMNFGELLTEGVFGKGKTTQQRLQAAHQMNIFKGKGDVDMVLGGKRTAEEEMGLTGSKTLLGGLLGMSGKPKDKNTKAQIPKSKPKNVRGGGVKPSTPPKPKVVYGPPAPKKRNVRGGGSSTKTPSFSATTNGMRSKQETLGLMR